MGNNWYNTDTVKGIQGSFSVQNLTGNSGFMKGSFDFCDLTPPVNSPFIDYNIGTISSYITYCNNVSVGKNALLPDFSLFPNPANNNLFIKSSGKAFVVDILNITGEHIYTANNISQIELSHFAKGMYIFIAKDISGNIIYRQRFVKE